MSSVTRDPESWACVLRPQTVMYSVHLSSTGREDIGFIDKYIEDELINTKILKILKG